MQVALKAMMPTPGRREMLKNPDKNDASSACPLSSPAMKAAVNAALAAFGSDKDVVE